MVRFRVQAINDLPKFIGRYAAEQLQFKKIFAIVAISLVQHRFGDLK
jgi:hypothetical protein